MTNINLTFHSCFCSIFVSFFLFRAEFVVSDFTKGPIGQLSHLVVLHGGVVLSYRHVVFGGRRILLQLQDVHGFLPLSSRNRRFDGFQRAAERGNNRPDVTVCANVMITCVAPPTFCSTERAELKVNLIWLNELLLGTRLRLKLFLAEEIIKQERYF